MASALLRRSPACLSLSCSRTLTSIALTGRFSFPSCTSSDGLGLTVNRNRLAPRWTTRFPTLVRRRRSLKGVPSGTPFLWIIAMTPADFIADFFRDSTGSIYLCSLPNERDGGRPAEICGRGDGGRLNTLVLQTWDRRDRGTFFCVNTVTPGQARRSKETVHEVTCLHCDLDFSKIDTAPDTVLQQLRALEYPPSKIVRSGHGLHGYWLLREPPAATPETVLQAETALRGIADILGRDPAVAEIARLMRLPGSHNTKNGERLPVTVVSDTGARFELDDLCQWINDTRILI